MSALLFLNLFLYHRIHSRIAGPIAIHSGFHRRCSKCGLSFLPLYLSVMAVLKNEGSYLEEWIEYHLLVGVEYFDLTLNNNQDNSSEVLRPYISLGLVRLSSRDGPTTQLDIYNWRIPFFRNESCWVAIIDIDEFMVPLEGHSVQEIMRRFEDAPGVRMNWVTFGTNGLKTRENGLVIERFPRHTAFDLYRNRHTKTIVNPRMVVRCAVHVHFYVNGKVEVDVQGRELRRSCLEHPAVHITLRVNHYWTKSEEEFRLKRLRGRATLRGDWVVRQLLSAFQADVNCVPDVVANDSGVAWAVPLVKENIAKRHLDLLDGPYH
jgi:hypothetical protein